MAAGLAPCRGSHPCLLWSLFLSLPRHLLITALWEELLLTAGSHRVPPSSLFSLPLCRASAKKQPCTIWTVGEICVHDVKLKMWSQSLCMDKDRWAPCACVNIKETASAKQPAAQNPPHWVFRVMLPDRGILMFVDYIDWGHLFFFFFFPWAKGNSIFGLSIESSSFPQVTWGSMRRPCRPMQQPFLRQLKEEVYRQNPTWDYSSSGLCWVIIVNLSKHRSLYGYTCFYKFRCHNGELGNDQTIVVVILVISHAVFEWPFLFEEDTSNYVTPYILETTAVIDNV